MKKIALLILALIAILMLSGCNSSPTITYSDSAVLNTSESAGAHCLFATTDVKDYLNFLDSFDETKYEIISINFSIDNNGWLNYYVTYKVLPEETIENE